MFLSASGTWGSDNLCVQDVGMERETEGGDAGISPRSRHNNRWGTLLVLIDCSGYWVNEKKHSEQGLKN